MSEQDRFEPFTADEITQLISGLYDVEQTIRAAYYDGQRPAWITERLAIMKPLQQEMEAALRKRAKK